MYQRISFICWHSVLGFCVPISQFIYSTQTLEEPCGSSPEWDASGEIRNGEVWVSVLSQGWACEEGVWDEVGLQLGALWNVTYFKLLSKEQTEQMCL
jgi:hypothetical protein